MVEVRKREKESVESMIRRFTRRIQKSEVLVQARSSRFLTKGKSKTKQRQAAIKKVQFLSEKDKLVKMGKVRSNEKLPNKYKLKIKASIK
jgi:ribosomal protein S21